MDYTESMWANWFFYNMLLHKATRCIHNAVLKMTKQNHAFQAHVIYVKYTTTYILYYILNIFQMNAYSVSINFITWNNSFIYHHTEKYFGYVFFGFEVDALHHVQSIFVNKIPRIKTFWMAPCIFYLTNSKLSSHSTILITREYNSMQQK
jgi:hypothetical protein